MGLGGSSAERFKDGLPAQIAARWDQIDLESGTQCVAIVECVTTLPWRLLHASPSVVDLGRSQHLSVTEQDGHAALPGADFTELVGSKSASNNIVLGKSEPRRRANPQP